jgi:hypothetical protein
MYKSVVDKDKDKDKIQKFGACSPLRPFSAARAVAEEWVDRASSSLAPEDSSSLAPEDRDSPSNLAKENLLEERRRRSVFVLVLCIVIYDDVRSLPPKAP